MRRGRWLRTVTLAVLVALAAMAVACGPSGPTEEELAAAASAEEWRWLTETKSTLDAQRAELGQLRERLLHGEAEPPAETETETEADDAAEDAAPAVPLDEQIASLESGVNAAADELMGRLIGFINDQGISVGGELDETQLAAIRMKSSEEMLLAREYIDRGGDYAKAIDIYNQSLQFDPDNDELKAALAAAETDRYMTEERFALVKKKMTQVEVRAAIGQVHLHNVKPYEKEGTVAWFYRKDDGGAAGVWFKERKKGQGDWYVYSTKFDAVKPQDGGG